MRVGALCGGARQAASARGSNYPYRTQYLLVPIAREGLFRQRILLQLLSSLNGTWPTLHGASDHDAAAVQARLARSSALWARRSAPSTMRPGPTPSMTKIGSRPTSGTSTSPSSTPLARRLTCRRLARRSSACVEMIQVGKPW